MARINDQQKKAIQSLRAAGLGYKSIAARLSLPLGTVKSYCARKCGKPRPSSQPRPFLAAVNGVLNGRKKAIAAFETAKSTVFDTTALEIEAASLETEMQVISEKIQALIRENATIALDQEEYQKKFQAMSDRFEQAKAKKIETEKQIVDKKARLGEVEEYMRLLKKLGGRVEEFNSELWCGLLDYVTVGENNMVFTFRDGTEVGV